MKPCNQAAIAASLAVICSSPVTASAVAARFGLSSSAFVFNDSESVGELQNRLLQLRDAAKGIEARAAFEQRELTDDEQDEIAGIFAQFESLEARIDMAGRGAQDSAPTCETRAQAAQRQGNTGGRPTQRAQNNAVRESYMAVPGARGRDEINTQAAGRMGIVLNRGIKSPSAALFGPSNGGQTWRNSEEFFRTLANGIADPRLISNLTGTEGTGSDGGFIVPSEWYRGLVDTMLQKAMLAQRCRLFGTPSNNINIPMLDTSDRRSSIAGIAAQWVAEASQGTAQKLKFKLVAAKLKKIMILAEASNELLEDGIGFETQLMTAFDGSTGYAMDSAIINGSGIGQPLGILRSDSAIEISPESGQVSDTLVYANLVNMFSRIHPSSVQNAVWLYSQAALPQLLSMTIPGGQGNPVLLSGGPNDAAAGAPAQTIFGLPAMSNECMPALGDRGDLILVDLTQYALMLKSSARIAYDGAPGFDRDVATWRLTLRADGLPMWNTAITPRNSGPSLSWAIVLGAR